MVDVQPVVACATPPGEGAIAIVRASGQGIFDLSDQFFLPDDGSSFSSAPERIMILGRLVDSDRVIDRPLAVRFIGPKSYTGEDMVEFHLHGNPLIVNSALRLFLRHGCRLAEPGEFTRRAFLNGKMDLTQAEGLGELIKAESDAALDLAQHQLGGELSRKFRHFRKQLVDFLALLELELDFVQEGYELLDYDQLDQTIQKLRDQVDQILSSYRSGDLLRRGPRILLLGKPNAGKSSLFNAILGYDRSLVSQIPGTTRDYIEERIYYRGVALHLLDSAGLRQTSDAIEAEGVSRVYNLIPLADHILYLIDGALHPHDLQAELRSLSDLSQAYPQNQFYPVYTKADILPSTLYTDDHISIHQPLSVQRLLDAIISRYSMSTTSRLVLLSQRQCHLLQTIQNLLSTISPLSSPSTELLSSDLRSLLHPLSELTGEVTNEDILDAVFSGFCIGK